MRAHFVKDLEEKESYLLEGESLHHLVNVIRIRKDEEILLLNGQGLGVIAQVENISKKNMSLRLLRVLPQPKKLPMDLALGIPKKDSLDLCLKQAVELGFERIFLVRGQFSQTKVPEADRLQNLLVSALEQANAFYLPRVVEISWQELPWNEFGSTLLMDSRPVLNQTEAEVSARALRLLIVGPEGGFSEEELVYFHSRPNITSLHLPTPILRTSTAVATGAGILLQRLMD